MLVYSSTCLLSWLYVSCLPSPLCLPTIQLPYLSTWFPSCLLFLMLVCSSTSLRSWLYAICLHSLYACLTANLLTFLLDSLAVCLLSYACLPHNLLTFLSTCLVVYLPSYIATLQSSYLPVELNSHLPSLTPAYLPTYSPSCLFP